MSITEELKKWANRRSDAMRDPLLAIAEHIDEAHEREVTMAHGEAVTELGSNVARNYVKLPVDADGEVIHLGDEVYHFNDAPGHHSSVKALELTENGWMVDRGCKPSHLRHWKAPTVEGTLRELVEHVTPGVEWEDELFAEYADRIREAVEHE